MTGPLTTPDTQGPDPGQDGADLVRGAAANALALLAANFRAAFTFLIARLLGEAALGSFSLAFATTDLLSKFGTFGLDNATVPLVAQRQARGDTQGSRHILRIAVVFGLLASLVTAAVGIGLGRLLGSRLGQPPPLVQATALMLLALPGIALYRISNGVSRGCKAMRHDFFSRGLAETWVTIAAFLIAFGLGLRALAPVVAVVLGTAAGGLLAFALARRLVPGGPAVAPPPTASEVIGFAAPVAGYSLLNLLIMRMDVLLLGSLVGRAPGLTLESFGVFCAAVEIAGGMRKVRQVFDPILAPVVAARLVTQDRGSLQEILAKVGRWVLATQLPLVGVLALAGGLVLSIFGPGFRQGAPLLLILGLAHGANAFVGLAETVIMIRRPALNLLNSTLTAAAQAILTLALIRRFGALGAALGTLLAYSLQGTLRFLELRVLFGWTWPWRSLRTPALAFAIAVAVGLIPRLGLPGALGEIVGGILFLCAYVLTWKVLGLPAEDREAFRLAWSGPKRSQRG